jgi:hypothetical protein
MGVAVFLGIRGIMEGIMGRTPKYAATRAFWGAAAWKRLGTTGLDIKPNLTAPLGYAHADVYIINLKNI